MSSGEIGIEQGLDVSKDFGGLQKEEVSFDLDFGFTGMGVKRPFSVTRGTISLEDPNDLPALGVREVVQDTLTIRGRARLRDVVTSYTCPDDGTEDHRRIVRVSLKVDPVEILDIDIHQVLNDKGKERPSPVFFHAVGTND